MKIFNYEMNNQKIFVIPVHYLLFLKRLRNDNNISDFSEKYFLNYEEIADIVGETQTFLSSNKIGIGEIIFDMKNIYNYKPSGSRKIEIQDSLKNRIFFSNIKNPDTAANLKLEIGIEEKFFNNAEKEVQVEKILKNEVINILKNANKNAPKIIEEGVFPLASSGVYANKYINIKNLFYHVDDFNYIVYKLAESLCEKKFDILVAASRTGSILASIISKIVNKDYIYYRGLGPKFSITKKSKEVQIMKGKKYVFIFDFICLGTELKELNALIEIEGASLVYGIGISNYIDIGKNKTIKEKDVLSRMDSLINCDELDIGYEIAMTKKEYELMRNSKKDVVI